MAKGERIFLKLRTSDLCELFSCSPETLRRWIRQGKLDPTSFLDIVDKLDKPWLLDKRKKGRPCSLTPYIPRYL